MNAYIGLSGVAGAGKDTFYEILQRYIKKNDIMAMKVSIPNIFTSDSFIF